MSSRKTAAAKASVRRAPAARPAAKPSGKIAADAAGTAAGTAASTEATQLAAEIERGLRDGRLDTLTPKAFQALMAAMCKSYSAQLEAGSEFLPLADRNSVSPTEIMMTTSALLKAANLAVFELGMWQSWTGR
jgi:hypothetical protein